MNLSFLKTFRTIVKHGSFRLAAEELMYAQSTVTSQIKKLESDLGVRLLERGKTIQLTESGKLLYKKGNILLKLVENLQTSMGEINEGTSKVIKIGVMEPAASYIFPALLNTFVKQFPNVKISLQIHDSKVLSEMVIKGEVSFAFCVAPNITDQLFFESLHSEKMVLLAPSEHHLNGKEIVYLKELKGERLIATDTNCPFRGCFEKEMIEVGVTPDYGIEVSDILTVKRYVQFGFGVAVVPLISVSPPPKGTVVKSIADFQQGLSIGIARKSDFESDKETEKLLEIIYKAF